MNHLDNEKVLIIGVGGIGSHVAVSLCRGGMKHLHLVDADVVEESNLGRQYYTHDDIGILKVEAMQSHLHRIMPHCEVTIQNEWLTPESLRCIGNHYSYIIEAVDRAATKAWIAETVLGSTEKTILISSSGMAGWGNSEDIHIKAVNKRWYICGDGKSDIEEVGKITAPRVMVCAGHMANIVLQLCRGVV